MWREWRLKFGLGSLSVQTTKFVMCCFVLLVLLMVCGMHHRGMLHMGGKLILYMSLQYDS